MASFDVHWQYAVLDTYRIFHNFQNIIQSAQMVRNKVLYKGANTRDTKVATILLQEIAKPSIRNATNQCRNSFRDDDVAKDLT